MSLYTDGVLTGEPPSTKSKSMAKQAECNLKSKFSWQCFLGMLIVGTEDSSTIWTNQIFCFCFSTVVQTVLCLRFYPLLCNVLLELAWLACATLSGYYALSLWTVNNIYFYSVSQSLHNHAFKYYQFN